MNFLNEIIAVKKKEVKELKRIYTLNSFSDFEFFDQSCLSFKINLNESHLAVISEIKKASPSKGILKKNFNHIDIANLYQSLNVDAISILTDEKFFMGNITFLQDIARIKQQPVLRKDFIINEYQVFEAKANGADIILLISEILSKTQINELTQCAYELGLEVLLEIHSENQIEKIDFGQNDLIGINNRNLESFKTDINNTHRIKPKIPEFVKVISESGISNTSVVQRLKESHVHGVLVGEHFMKANDLEKSLMEFIEACK